ncbi:hypothetical protein ECOK1357_2526 [Escherichia coli OK1357]|nr:hypothetical protein ECOK1357_2526 [Escherichia coli OK1357]
MNHRHLAKCQSCRIINDNRKLWRLYRQNTLPVPWLQTGCV